MATKAKTLFADAIDMVSEKLAAAMVLAPRGALVESLRKARAALIASDLAAGEWESGDFAELDSETAMEVLASAMEKRECVELSLTAWSTARVERSRLDPNVWRLCVDKFELIANVHAEDGYGDDGTHWRYVADVLASGEVPHV